MTLDRPKFKPYPLHLATEKIPLPLLRLQKKLSYGFFWYIHGVTFLYLNLLSIWNLFLEWEPEAQEARY